MNKKNDLSHPLTTLEALTLVADTYEHHYNRIPLFGLLDKIHEDTAAGKTIGLVPTMRHWGRHGHEHVRSAILHGKEVLSFIDNSYEVVERVCGWSKVQLSGLPTDRNAVWAKSAMDTAVAVILRD